MKRSSILVLVGTCALALAGFVGNDALAPTNGLDPWDPRVTLQHVEVEVERRWTVPTVAVRDLNTQFAETGAALFDVREPEEYEMGHLPGAIRVDPSISAEAFYEAYGHHVQGRPIILYCSVGVRSSQLAKRLASTITIQGRPSVYNLRGGAFRWVAEGRHLLAGSAPGRLHPYDSAWEKLFIRTLAIE